MNVSQLVTYGIGTPGDIPHVILLGLTPTGPIADIDFLCAHLTSAAPTVTLTAQPAGVTVTWTIQEC